MFLEALTGFAGGAADEVVEISKDERTQLAQKLRDEALAEIDKLHQSRGFQHQKDIVDIEQKNRMALEGERTKNEGILEKTRQGNRMSVAEREAALKEKLSEKEFLRQKEAGAFDKKPISVGPGEKLVDYSGKEIARSDIESTSDKRTSDEKNYERFLSENPNYNGDFMSWKKSWSASDKTKMAYDLAQNDMRVLKSPDKIHEIAKEYISKLSSDQSQSTSVNPQGQSSLNIMDYVSKGRALRGIK